MKINIIGIKADLITFLGHSHHDKFCRLLAHRLKVELPVSSEIFGKMENLCWDNWVLSSQIPLVPRLQTRLNHIFEQVKIMLILKLLKSKEKYCTGHFRSVFVQPWTLENLKFNLN